MTAETTALDPNAERRREVREKLEEALELVDSDQWVSVVIAAINVDSDTTVVTSGYRSAALAGALFFALCRIGMSGWDDL